MSASSAATTDAAYFSALYREDDPFGYRTRWYEARKRALLLAMLPRAEFASAWELGCSNGELTVALAGRCARLLATDLAPRAVALAQRRSAELAHVRVACMQHPAQWPAGRFDLIVFSEVGYYLGASELADAGRRLRDSLDPDGVLVAAHWLHPFAEAPLDGRQVHAGLACVFGAPDCRYVDDDVLIELWSTTRRSVAQREALR
ncbi:SAM-dependent methyltransferase [Luteimonas deserti]|uniref:Methyltransferase domain-containing protein n=1 Tax=Luteimonas deserti TaxID=2752306 RepID=A0A7Z0QRP1_9GAMM|nr:SAM-dependent methyltransferase [Luteimonas deserti]NYZ62597.1 methyltransferase domain-containing protein [Luteimonas deserti]